MAKSHASNFLDQESKRIPCLVLPMRKTSLLLPALAVAEVDAVTPFKPEANLKPCDYGKYIWHDVPIPLIDVDVLDYRKSPMEKVRYIAIIHSQKEETDIPFFAFAMTGIPEQYAIEHGDLQLDVVTKSRHTIAMVVLDKKTLKIPDLDAIELEITK